MLREELEGTGVRMQQLILEVSEAEAVAQDQAALAAHNAANLEETITQERRRRGDVELELRQIQEVSGEGAFVYNHMCGHSSTVPHIFLAPR